MNDGPLLVVCALRAERWALRGGTWSQAPYGVRLLRTGMGPDRTRWAVARALAGTGAGERHDSGAAPVAGPPLPQAPGALLVTGFCAAAGPGSRPGDVVVAERVQDAAGAAAALPDAGELAELLRAQGLTVRTGTLHSAERVVRGARQRAELAAAGVLGIDMETAAAFRHAPAALPRAAVRVVVDTPERELLRPGTLAGGMRAWRALRAAAPAFAAWHRGLSGVPHAAAGNRAP